MMNYPASGTVDLKMGGKRSREDQTGDDTVELRF